MIEIASATRLDEEKFWSNSALGQSLRRLNNDQLIPRIAFKNTKGLPEIYNSRILSAEKPDILVFIHDDVWIDDFFFYERVIEGLNTFDVIGVAGNRRRAPNQPTWFSVDDKFTWDDPSNLSGRVAHASHPFGEISNFGPTPAKCELLDDLFLAVRKSVLHEKIVLFDQRFDFHFCDMDFCRTARIKGLNLGTWPICLTHESKGRFSSPEWKKNYLIYFEKWGS